MSAMLVKGVVTSINEKLLTFIVNNTTTVYLVLLFNANRSQKLPTIGSNVEVESEIAFMTDSTVEALILYPGCKLEGCFDIEISESNKFAQVVQDLDLQPKNLLDVYYNFKLLEQFFKSPHNISNEDLITAIIKTEPIIVNSQKEDMLNFELQFISQQKYVDIHEPEEYEGLDYWTLGTHWIQDKKGLKNVYLIGYLSVAERGGAVTFSDTNRHILCILTKPSLNDDIEKYINNYVLIRQYGIFTEIYKDQKPFYCEVLYIDLKNVIILDLSRSFKSEIIQKNIFFNIYKNRFCFRINMKSLPTMNFEHEVEYYLEVQYEQNKRMFICLPSYYLQIAPLLKPNSQYFVYHNEHLFQRKRFYKELHNLNRYLPQYKLPIHCVFVPIDIDNSSTEEVMTVDEAYQKLSVFTGMVTFQGAIKAKKFVSALSSRTTSFTKNPHFGTPGENTHLLEFTTQDDCVVTVYLNNWENMLTPLGLFPNVVVCVRNVVSQKGKYYKSTMFTAIEVLDYPDIYTFETASLVGGLQNLDWGRSCCFMAEMFLPKGVIVWDSIKFIKIIKVNVYHQCKVCLKEARFATPCTFCKQQDQQLTTNIKLDICEENVPWCKVIAIDKVGTLLLKLLLLMTDDEFKELDYGIGKIGSFDYPKNKPINQGPSTSYASTSGAGTSRTVNSSTHNPTTLEEEFELSLTDHFDKISTVNICLDFKCKNLGEMDDGLQTYFLIDVRRCKTSAI